MTRTPHRSPWTATALLLATLLLSACGATTTNPETDPTLTPAGTFDESTFDASTWR